MRIRTTAIVCLTCILAVFSPARAEASRAEAEKLLHDVAAAYRSAPAITDEVELVVSTPRGPMRDTLSVSIGKAGTSQINAGEHVFVAVDGQVYMYRPKLATKYFTTPLERDLVKSLQGYATLPMPHYGLRYGKTTDDYVAAFGATFGVDVALDDHQLVQHEGNMVHELTFTGSGLAIRALVDPQTKFVIQNEVSMGRTKLVLGMKPKKVETLPGPIAFDPSGRRRVDSPKNLTIGVGDVAPDFTLETVDGRSVTLRDYRGSVVVLDFWATWCGPCQRALPLLNQFAQWAEAEELAVEVFPIDVGERKPTREQKQATVASFWKRFGFSMTTLMDYDNAVAAAFEIGPIPHTVVIGPDGTIIEVEVGLNPNVVSHLQKLTNEALGQSS